MNMIKIFILLSVLFCNQSHWAKAQERNESNSTTTTTLPSAAVTNSATKVWPNFEKAFQEGVLAYQAKKFDVALPAFQFAVQQDSTNVQALVNLSLVQFQLGSKYEALALMRKAYSLDPYFAEADQGLRYLTKHIEVREIPHRISLWQNMHDNLFSQFTLSRFIFIHILTLVGFAWFLLVYLGKRKRAQLGDGEFPAVTVMNVLFALLFVVSTCLLICKWIDQSTSRGTVVVDKAVVYSAPAVDSVQLYELSGGSEVQMENYKKEQDKSWLQITYPGAATGWIQQDTILQTSGRIFE